MIEYQEQERQERYVNSYGAVRQIAALGRPFSYDRLRAAVHEGSLPAYFYKGGQPVRYIPGKSSQSASSGLVFRVEDIEHYAKVRPGAFEGEEEVPSIDFLNSEGAAQMLTKLLGMERDISHDSMRQYALRGRVHAYFFKNGHLTRYIPGMSAQGAASGFLFRISDIEELARTSKFGIGRGGYPFWLKDEALDAYYEANYEWELLKGLPEEKRPNIKKPSYRDIAALIKIPWDPDKKLSWMTLRNWVEAEKKKRGQKLIEEDQFDPEADLP